MLRRFRKRMNVMLIFMLVMSIVATSVPQPAYANIENSLLAENEGSEAQPFQDSAYYEELLSLLAEEYGEENAQWLLESLYAMNLINDGGMWVDHPIYLNDIAYSLQEIEAMLADEHVDLTQVAVVDGLPIPLGDMQLIIRLERELEQLGQTLDADEAEDIVLTPAHLESMKDLVYQLTEEGFSINETRNDFQDFGMMAASNEVFNDREQCLMPNMTVNDLDTNNPNHQWMFGCMAIASISIDKSDYYYHSGSSEPVKITVNLERSNQKIAEWIRRELGIYSPSTSSLSRTFNRVYAFNLGAWVGDGRMLPITWNNNEDMYKITGKFLLTEDFFSEWSPDWWDGGNTYENIMSEPYQISIYYNNDRGTGGPGENPLEYFMQLRVQGLSFGLYPTQFIKTADLAIIEPDAWRGTGGRTVDLQDNEEYQLTYNVPEDKTFRTPDQFTWRSENPEVASINSNGIIAFHKSGFVSFSLVAHNGGYGDPVIRTTAPIEVGSAYGSKATLTIPETVYFMKQGYENNLRISWSSNIREVYDRLASDRGEAAPETVEFTISVKRWEPQLKEFQEFYTEVQHYWPSENPDLSEEYSRVLPKEVFARNAQENYSFPSFDAPSLYITISTPNPLRSGEVLEKDIPVIRTPVHPEIELIEPFGKSFVDDVHEIELKWALGNLYRDSYSENTFRLIVTRNGKEVDRHQHVVYDRGVRIRDFVPGEQFGGTHPLRIMPVVGMENNRPRIRDLYQINIEAWNASFKVNGSKYLGAHVNTKRAFPPFYVYKENSLDIRVDGTPSAYLQLSNFNEIENMSHEELQTLINDRDLSLIRELTVNYADYNLEAGEHNQIRWEIDNDHPAFLAVKREGNYVDIRQLADNVFDAKEKVYVIGKEDGTSHVKATHVHTGISTDLQVKVETLKDKLYMFQFYPKAETFVTYAFGGHATSDENGRLVIFTNRGLGSVHAFSHFEGQIYQSKVDWPLLKSGENHAGVIGLYPVIQAGIRQISDIEMVISNPDGSPYIGELTARRSVYRNEAFCPNMSLMLEDITLDQDGRFKNEIDGLKLNQPNTCTRGGAPLSADDQLEIVYLLTFPDDAYMPQVIRLGSYVDDEGMYDFYRRHVILAANPSREKTPIVVGQYLTAPDGSKQTSILDYVGKFGPDEDMPAMMLTTEVMWWGEDVDSSTAYAELYGADGFKLPGQSSVTVRPPLSDYYITRHTQVLNKDTLWMPLGEARSLMLKVYGDNRTFRKEFVFTAQLANTFGLEAVDETALYESLDEMRDMMVKAKPNIAGNSAFGEFVQFGVDALNQLGIGTGPLHMDVIPTEDPLVYKTVIATSIGNLPTVGSHSTVEFLKQDQLSLTPGITDVFYMTQGKYLKEQKKKLERIKESGDYGRALYGFSGYYVGELRYNRDTKKWDNIVLGGGLNAGGGYEKSKIRNQMVGPVPVTFSITMGGSLEIGTNSSVLFEHVPGNDWYVNAKRVNDYLTTIRINAYIELFGGIGFDYGVAAAKVGAFGRISLQNETSQLNRYYSSKPGDRVVVGNKLSIEGRVGLQAKIKFLFFSSTYTFASLTYNHDWVFGHWKMIEEYWKKHTNTPLTAANVNVAIASYIEHIGEDEMHVLVADGLEDRRYLTEYERSWHSSPPMGKMSMKLDPLNAAPTALQTNAYPYANPQFAADGSLFVYLSDGNSMALEDTAVSWAKYNGTGFDDLGPIAPNGFPEGFEGFGDNNVQVAGEGDLVTAVWVTQKDSLDLTAGGEVEDDQLGKMLNDTEIVAAIYDGTQWTAHRLTNNSTPNLAPVVAVNEGKVFVAYREIISEYRDNPFDFSDIDHIMYTVYDGQQQTWSEADTLYGGGNGTVMGLSAAMLGDGTAAVLYSVNDNAYEALAADDIAGADNEIEYVIIDTKAAAVETNGEWSTEGIVYHTQVTSDDAVNDNPQLTTARFADNEERFIAGWFTLSGQGEDQESDIRLLAIDRDGQLASGFVSGFGDVQDENKVSVHPNFRFAKMGRDVNDIEHLSILWRESDFESAPSEIVARDIIKAVKFGLHEDDIYLSGVVAIATMPDETMADHFDAFVSNIANYETKVIVLGTTYNGALQSAGTIALKDTDEEMEILVSDSVSAMYTATGTYPNTFNADDMSAELGQMRSGQQLPMQFHVVNQGIDPIEAVTVELDGKVTTFDSLTIMPNKREVFTVYYEVPDPIVNPDYKVTVRFMDGVELSDGYALSLDVPDLGIAPVKVIEEADGKRMLAVPLYNRSSASLSDGSRVVKLGLYKNSIYTDDYLLGDVLTIDDAADLRQIDQGGHVVYTTLDLQAYLQQLQLDHIPDKGIPIYLSSWVEEADGEVIEEFVAMNNMAHILFEPLSRKYNENNVLLTLEQTQTETRTLVDVTMQNMTMAPLDSGNVLLRLLDASGHELESQVLANSAEELLSFKAEEKKQQQAQFTQRGATVQAMFFYESVDERDAALGNLKLEGIDFTFDAAQTSYVVQTTNRHQVRIQAVAANREAAITLLDDSGRTVATGQGHLQFNQPLTLATAGAVNKLTLRVTPSGAGRAARDYELELINTEQERPNLQVQVNGMPIQAGAYQPNAVLSMPAYQLDGFDMKQLMYKINDDDWVTVSYDGSERITLGRLTKEGAYRIQAKVILSSGAEHVLEPLALQVEGLSGTPGWSPEVTDEEELPDHEEEEASRSVFLHDKIDIEALRAKIRQMLLRDDDINTVQLTDITDHWAIESIEKLVTLGVIAGYPAGTFRPNNAITRAEFAKLLAQLLATDDLQDYAAAFSDTERHWANSAIARLVELGVVTGYADGTFRPDQTITREEIVVLLGRLLDEQAIPPTNTLEFSDHLSASPYARAAITTATAAGIVRGYDDATFRPKRETTRAETVTLLLRLLELDQEIKELLN